MPSTADAVQQRLKELESHLEQENPVLLSAVQSFREIDEVAYATGVLQTNQTFSSQIPWWPLISVLGTFSAGKSTFINHYLGEKLQRTGNQAVDDRFTVVVYSADPISHSLPGVSLDSDPRFPFYQMSRDIAHVDTAEDSGDGNRIDTYLQLKTCHSDRLRGKILIDSPGFDADAQRTTILRLTDHMIDLSDLVLVMFDARHPEPGAMRDTLKHLVRDTINRADSGKFLYILNQMDSAATEDNPEDVVAAWLRALGEAGLTAGRFYTVYSPDAGTTIADEHRRARFEKKRDEDLAEIYLRMERVEIERAYRIVAALRKTATDFTDGSMALLQQAKRRWRRRTLVTETILLALLAGAFMVWSLRAGHWHGLVYDPQWLDLFTTVSWGLWGLEGVIAVLVIGGHFTIRRLAALSVMPWLRKQVEKHNPPGDVIGAFQRNTRFWRTVLSGSPIGWSRRSRNTIDEVLQNCENYIQTLNERFTNPRGLPDKPRRGQSATESDSASA
ncbi:MULTISPECIES: dynamin family protein [Marichromatium]|uniref:Dynamin family protein n=1 Tax=Marichromatium gracile TaxID=1048 RepID=A0A4R4A9G7_MARGR|nr:MULTISPECIES: dynamin family protein [Marichromatium]MBO8084982.1 dynamin family protein [Marichromatium sp.]MBK1708541.1 dynamin family protein [Marichromatium gracile]RNE89907.1 dynamin family protein [Marichromatium sp. AB31]RNE94215.1 dynamin family protein [Marichromatium sp. AB32]TCW35568.1 dynamin family protein [Marichromatium gracile]